MNKLRIVQENWAGYTGDFGGVEFFDGVSVELVDDRRARRLANIIRIEIAEGERQGVNPSDSQMLIDMKNLPMDIEASVVAQTLVTSAMAPVQHTRESLEKIADESGIAGIRKISDPMGLKSNAVNKLIEMVLRAQSPDQPVSSVGLYGSNVQPSTFEVDGAQVQLGTVVADAFTASGLTAEDWNLLPDEVREQRIAEAVERLKVK
jgi:hypothetical protein